MRPFPAQKGPNSRESGADHAPDRKGVTSADQILRPSPDAPLRVCHGMTQVIRDDAMPAGDGVDLSGSRRHRHNTKTYPHIEDLVHLRLAHPPTRLNQAKDRLRLR